MIAKVLTGVCALLLGSAFSLQPVLANPPDQGYSKGHAGGSEREHGGGYGMGMGMSGHHATTGHLLRGLLRSQKEIGLSEDQVTKLKAIQLDLDRTRIKTEADIMVAERELSSLVEDSKADLGTIEAKVKQSETFQTSLRMTAIKARRDAMAVLTPEQSERVKIVHERMKNMGEMMGEHGGPPKGHPKKDEPKKESKPQS
jgi:Spy/CpxP family protein refolding chaperone